MTPETRRKIKRALVVCNGIHGKGTVRSVVFSKSGHSGIVVREFISMDAVQFTVADDCKTVRFLQHTRPVL